ncbi:MAG: PIN domain-containing protein [Anaerolinea sp.]|nr:PIN domain-containing protein [Anaerolinea sp.]
MVNALLDTSILVDLLRDYPAALSWYALKTDLGISRIAWMEVIEGVESRRKQYAALKLLKRFEIVELTSADMIWASDRLLRFSLSHNVDAFDCLIASANYRLGLTLFTRNLKHFTPLIGSLAQAPY